MEYLSKLISNGFAFTYCLRIGHVGWGISWYINGLLIPEINVVRGKTYTFVTEGGHDPDVPAKYHPFYITDDSVGGYEYKSEEEKSVCFFYHVRCCHLTLPQYSNYYFLLVPAIYVTCILSVHITELSCVVYTA